MAVSLTSQLAAVDKVAKLRPAELCRAVPSLRTAQAEMLLNQLKAAADTIAAVASDERIVRFIEKKQQ